MISSGRDASKAARNGGISAGSCCPSASRVTTAAAPGIERVAEAGAQRRALAGVRDLAQDRRAGRLGLGGRVVGRPVIDDDHRQVRGGRAHDRGDPLAFLVARDHGEDRWRRAGVHRPKYRRPAPFSGLPQGRRWTMRDPDGPHHEGAPTMDHQRRARQPIADGRDVQPSGPAGRARSALAVDRRRGDRARGRRRRHLDGGVPVAARSRPRQPRTSV